ncbi:multifunctional CCA tRNA nucleotidyl transferase/2'3'-cyclic phosphodiesterase/2'nucleotidase/phosphatase [Marinobacter sp. X15-166B]|uniref:multifunctional CCA tRNA nucleotidyl transferase/2'3'-cyclic phosphodiesterase/2'nucleotidase/phosphatase n=1 Tax=Marinobacter sp. X15-166B TaxID=1897620 RepID=UPI00085C3F7D|nr:multifunctional CCA tRNA nucleotidyl transferase/2'3'-cyclic phosphodiesterase/2'nucleotidase/phosphatase [Marinobacter sp. X15-166B]OEY65545.1 multifunctional CCA tRNA nucleotidyl transferase/2'3'-cyclic phosphodiesterase/2'nucleotidase/phosphatase [Marinobacter sp. X15-166B]
MDIYLVGGAVRDQLLGIAVKDRDWVVVGATPAEMIDRGFRQVGADFPVFLHPDTNEEYALARTERKQGQGYHGFAVYSAPDVSLQDDLKRRDLTINAMARDGDGQVIDPFGGQRDITTRTLRHVSAAFEEDPLRILRIARFAARFQPLGFQVAHETMALMGQMVARGDVGHLVAERVWQEIQRALHEQSPVTFFQVLQDCGALAELMPELVAGALPRALAALQRAAEDDCPTDVRVAALLSPLPTDKAAARAKSLKAPNDCQELVRLFGDLAPAIQRPGNDPAALLSILERGDAWRRPQRFERLLCTVRCATPADIGPTVALLLQAGARCRDVNARDLMAQGYTGRELGQAIRAERLSRIQDLIQAP